MNFTCLVQSTEHTIPRGRVERLDAHHTWNIYHTTPGDEPITPQQREKRNVLSQNQLKLRAITFNYTLWNCAYCAVLFQRVLPSRASLRAFQNSVDFCVVGLSRGLRFIPHFMEGTILFNERASLRCQHRNPVNQLMTRLVKTPPEV